jgi:ABC-type tungstate transport system substrate-binding protein
VNDFAIAFATAFDLIGRLDPQLRGIVCLSMTVSLTASLLAFAIGAPLGSALSVYRFPGRSALIVVANALLGLPPVVVGLVVYLLLSRSFGIVWHLVYSNRNGDSAELACAPYRSRARPSNDSKLVGDLR